MQEGELETDGVLVDTIKVKSGLVVSDVLKIKKLMVVKANACVSREVFERFFNVSTGGIQIKKVIFTIFSTVYTKWG